jgi:putative ABC transport system permease protein
LIGLQLAIKSILREPRRHTVAILGMVSVLVPLMLLWSMKVGFISGLMRELRSAPSNLELRLRGDYLLDQAKVAEVRALPGVGFVIPTARLLATRAFASLPDGAHRTPVSLMPTAAGDPLTIGAPAISDIKDALVSKALSEKLGVPVGGTITMSNQRRDENETLRLDLRVVGIVAGEGVGGQWIFVSPDLVQDVEAFIDGYSVPSLGLDGKQATGRPPTYSGLRIYAEKIEAVAGVAAALQQMGFVAESNAARIENVLRLDRVLNMIVIAMGGILLAGLCLSSWAGLSAMLAQLKRHVALLALMGAPRSSVGLYFVVIGSFAAFGGTLLAVLSSYGLASIGNRLLISTTGSDRPIFTLPSTDVAGLSVLVLLIQLVIATTVAMRATNIHPREMIRDD